MEFRHPKQRAPAELPGKETVQTFFITRFLGSHFTFSKVVREFSSKISDSRMDFVPNILIQGRFKSKNLKKTCFVRSFLSGVSIGGWTTPSSLPKPRLARFGRCSCAGSHGAFQQMMASTRHGIHMFLGVPCHEERRGISGRSSPTKHTSASTQPLRGLSPIIFLAGRM